MEPVYLDYNATTLIKPAVIETVAKTMHIGGNASSIHAFGREARGIVEKAREHVAALVRTAPTQVVFTSGATESNNMVLRPFMDQRMIISSIEHPAVSEAVPNAETIPVTPQGIIDMEAFEAMLREGETPAIISCMLVNNETGVIQPVEDMARLAKSIFPGILFHCDAAQAAGRIDINFAKMQLDYLSLSAHKFGGPQGVGALIHAPGVPMTKYMFGGAQERYQRAGTENVAGIAGMGVAAELAVTDMPAYQELAYLRDKLETAITSHAPEAVIYGRDLPRVSNTCAVGLPGITSDLQMMRLDLAGICCSSGAACSSGKIKPSKVLLAMGVDEEFANCALRISLGWASTEQDIDRCVAAWCAMYDKLKDKLKAA
jgi:cysteine desulfurase